MDPQGGAGVSFVNLFLHPSNTDGTLLALQLGSQDFLGKGLKLLGTSRVKKVSVSS